MSEKVYIVENCDCGYEIYRTHEGALTGILKDYAEHGLDGWEREVKRFFEDFCKDNPDIPSYREHDLLHMIGNIRNELRDLAENGYIEEFAYIHEADMND